MTGQKRINSFITSFDTPSPAGSRKNSHDLPIDDIPLDSNNPPIDDENYVDDLLQYSARKFSVAVPLKKKNVERTILDDADYFMNKKECDYGMCQCCHVEKKLPTNWESIEEIIGNDPEIIFDCDDNPIVVEPVKETQDSFLYSGAALVGRVSKTLNLEKLPVLFKSICNKVSNSSVT